MSRLSSSLRFRLAMFVLPFVASIVVSSSRADEFPVNPPLPGPAPTLVFPAPDRFVLPHGLDVVVIRHGRLPLFTAELLIKS